MSSVRDSARQQSDHSDDSEIFSVSQSSTKPAQRKLKAEQPALSEQAVPSEHAMDIQEPWFYVSVYKVFLPNALRHSVRVAQFTIRLTIVERNGQRYQRMHKSKQEFPSTLQHEGFVTLSASGLNVHKTDYDAVVPIILQSRLPKPLPIDYDGPSLVNTEEQYKESFMLDFEGEKVLFHENADTILASAYLLVEVMRLPTWRHESYVVAWSVLALNDVLRFVDTEVPVMLFRNTKMDYYNVPSELQNRQPKQIGEICLRFGVIAAPGRRTLHGMRPSIPTDVEVVNDFLVDHSENDSEHSTPQVTEHQDGTYNPLAVQIIDELIASSLAISQAQPAFEGRVAPNLTIRTHSKFSSALTSAIALSPSALGACAVYCSSGVYNIILFNACTGSSVFILGTHFGYVYRMTFSEDGDYLATASSDGTALVFDVQPFFDCHTSPVRRDAAIVELGYLLEASASNKIDANEALPLAFMNRVQKIHLMARISDGLCVYDCSFVAHPTQSTPVLATCGLRGSLTLHDIYRRIGEQNPDGFAPSFVVCEHTTYINSVQFVPFGRSRKLVFTADSGGLICVTKLEYNQSSMKFVCSEVRRIDTHMSIKDIAVLLGNKNAYRILILRNDSTVVLMDDTGRVLSDLSVRLRQQSGGNLPDSGPSIISSGAPIRGIMRMAVSPTRSMACLPCLGTGLIIITSSGRFVESSWLTADPSPTTSYVASVAWHSRVPLLACALANRGQSSQAFGIHLLGYLGLEASSDDTHSPADRVTAFQNETENLDEVTTSQPDDILGSLPMLASMRKKPSQIPPSDIDLLNAFMQELRDYKN